MKNNLNGWIITVLLVSAMQLDVVSEELGEDSVGIPQPVVDANYRENGQHSQAKVDLGRMLFFDKILSGNRNISCATCHHPTHGTSDGVALSFGEGAVGLGPQRSPGETKSTAVHGRIPRNSPALFNLGAKEFTRLFHDGRVEEDPDKNYASGFITPAKWKLPSGLDSVLAAQALFPVLSPDEMAGQKHENVVADRVSLNRASGSDGAWEAIARRLRSIPEYRSMFKRAYPHEIDKAADISMVHAANAIAAFESAEFRADDSPFDRFLRGNREAMSPSAVKGMNLFYGEAKCSQCHSGKFQTDHNFHAIAMPQIGPGKSDGQDAGYWRASGHRGFPEDWGRGRVTARSKDNYKFRTPSLRNVAVTGPWGHSGAFDSLEKVLRHHLDTSASLAKYSVPENHLPPLSKVLETTARGASLDHQWVASSRFEGFLLRDEWVISQPHLRKKIAAAGELDKMELSEQQIDDLLAFMDALTDASSINKRHIVPDKVPSGLPVDD